METDQIIKILERTLLAISIIFLMGCIPDAGLNGSEATTSPTFCTGWDCQINGVVYSGSEEEGNQLGGVTISLRHISNCSPSPEEQQIMTDDKGEFTFKVYIHDTDSFVITTEIDDYESEAIKFGGFDCLYCHCREIAVILKSNTP